MDRSRAEVWNTSRCHTALKTRPSEGGGRAALLLDTVLARRFDDPRTAVGPIVAAS
jgi:hypothetical protein